jgi:undecaprenyl-diphosphatase
VAGLLLGDTIEQRFRWPLAIAASTAGWALVMAVADRRAVPAPLAPGDPLERIGWRQGIAIGLAQAIALFPGTSRSGITITAALLGGIDRATAARFSFLLGIPVTAGAGGLKALELQRAGLPAGDLGPLLVALVAAFVSGWFAVWFLVTYLRRRSLTPFVIYRLALAMVIVVLAI